MLALDVSGPQQHDVSMEMPHRQDWSGGQTSLHEHTSTSFSAKEICFCLAILRFLERSWATNSILEIKAYEVAKFGVSLYTSTLAGNLQVVNDFGSH